MLLFKLRSTLSDFFVINLLQQFLLIILIKILLMMLLTTTGIEALASSKVVIYVGGIHYRDVDLAIFVHIDHGDVYVWAEGIIVLVDLKIVLIISINDDALIVIAVDLLLTHIGAIKTQKTLVHYSCVLLLLYHVVSKHVVTEHVATIEPEETCIHAFIFNFKCLSSGRRCFCE